MTGSRSVTGSPGDADEVVGPRDQRDDDSERFADVERSFVREKVGVEDFDWVAFDAPSPRNPLPVPYRNGGLWELPAGIIEADEQSPEGVVHCAARELREDFHANLGRGFDARCCHFLRVVYAELTARVLAGGTDSLCRLTYSGFNALGAIDPNPCRPFDAKRAGLNLGEGAAFIATQSKLVAAVGMGAGVTDLFSDFSQSWGWSYPVNDGSFRPLNQSVRRSDRGVVDQSPLPTGATKSCRKIHGEQDQ